MPTLHDTATHTTSDPVRSIVADTIGSLYRQLHHAEPPTELDPNLRLDADLGFDSLARVELLARLERALGLDVPQSALNSAATVADILQFAAASGDGLHAASDSTRRPVARRAAEPRKPTAVPSTATTLMEVLNWRAQHQPHTLHAIVLGDREPTDLSYAALLTGARAVAGGLADLKIAPQSAVALMLPTGIEYLQAFFGVLLAGAVPVPMYPPLLRTALADHLRRQTLILENAGAEVLITFAEARAVLTRERTRGLGLRHVVSVTELTTADRPAPPSNGTGADAVALLQYTSGSTGSPKGVLLTHKQLLANIRAMGSSIGASNTDVFVSWLPLYHDMGLIGAWLGSLYYGCLCVLLPPTAFLARPIRWLQAIHQFRATLSASPNFGYELIAQRVSNDQLEGLDLSSLRATFNGAEPVAAETLERFARRLAPYGYRSQVMTPVYGLAEAGVGLTFPPLGRGPLVDYVDRTHLAHTGEALAVPAGASACPFVSCGVPLPGYQLKIVDEHGSQVAERIEGDLLFTGPSATHGYYRNAQATATLLCGPWRRTGDRGYLAAGELYVTGRAKDIIIRRGKHLYPEPIERAVETLSGVRKGCVAAFGVTAPNLGTERLIVVAETNLTEPARRQQLQSLIMERVTAAIGEPPDQIVLATPRSILKTSSGKLRRAATREAYLEKSFTQKTHTDTRLRILLAVARLSRAANNGYRETMRLIYGVYAWCLMLTCTATAMILTMTVRDPVTAWRRFHRAARQIVRLMGLPVTITWECRPDLQKAHILVANHSSYADSLILMALLDSPHRFVAKAELAHTPILGRLLSKLRTLFIERFAPQRSTHEVERIEDCLRRGESVVVFPEGTFRRAAGLRAFHLGAFQAAVGSAAPVIPVALAGTRSVLRDGDWVPRRQAVRIVIGHALTSHAGDDRFNAAVDLRDRARTHILRHCGEPDLTSRSPALEP